MTMYRNAFICIGFVLISAVVSGERECYWNRPCAYQLYSSKTPYDTVRGDIRDYPALEGCEAISLWSLNRHGNRNPGDGVTANMRSIGLLRDQIVASYDAGNSLLCAQDIDEFRRWSWNDTMDISQSFLTGTGYEELYDLAQRIRAKYPQLLNSSSSSDYYFRPTNEQRTVASAMAFTHGLSDGLALNLTIDGPWDVDNVIRPYSTCERYRAEVRGDGSPGDIQLAAFQSTDAFTAVQRAVQNRLGIARQLSRDEVYHFYEICRFFRSWTPTKQSPWCSVFSDEDLVVLEYRDDIRHYYRNGYASWMNARLGQPVLGDLYSTFSSAVNGSGRAITSYFSHDTMLQMAFTAAGLYRDDFTLLGDNAVPNRLYRTSYIAAFATNFVAVLNRCGSTTPSHRVQIFLNERETAICPVAGCTWNEFQGRFQPFTNSNLDFCSLDYVLDDQNNGAVMQTRLTGLVLVTGIFFGRISSIL